MKYSDYHTKNLIGEALHAYHRIPLQSRKCSLLFVKDTYHYEEYQMFLEPVNKLVEMGELDFDARSSLEDIVKILKTKNK